MTPPINDDARALRAAFEARWRTPGYDQRSCAERRRELEGLARAFPLPPGTEVRPVRIGGVAAAWITPARADARRCVLYLHGGGFTRGSIASHRELAYRIGAACDAPALVLDYRLAPEHPFPAALDDAVAACRAVTDEVGIAPDQVVLAGDSAGGGLAVSTLLALRDAGAALPGAAVLLSPWADLRVARAAAGGGPEADPVVSAADVAQSAAWYLGGHPPEDPLVSPVLAALDGLPPLLVIAGGRERLLGDAVDLAAAAERAGVRVELRVVPGLFHAFPLFGWLPESAAALEAIHDFVVALRDRAGRLG